jgi:hypothetical protein
MYKSPSYNRPALRVTMPGLTRPYPPKVHLSQAIVEKGAEV